MEMRRERASDKDKHEETGVRDHINRQRRKIIRIKNGI